MHMWRNLAVIATATVVSSLAAAQTWKPAEPVKLVVPWAPGGATDSVSRVTAKVLADALGGTITVLNIQGASGSIGTKQVWDAPHNGLMWAAGAAANVGSYPVEGTLMVPIQDWKAYLTVADGSIVSVNADTEWKDFGALLERLKDKDAAPLKIATSGLSAVTMITMKAMEAVAPVRYEPVVYDGGQAAVLSTVSGETRLTAQNISEQIAMIRANKLRPLAVVSQKPLHIEGYGDIPPITNWLQDMNTALNYFGIFVPADAPQEVINTLDALWETTIPESKALKEYATGRGVMFDPLHGEDAQKAAMPFIAVNAWTLYEANKDQYADPLKFGIPKPPGF